jgi:hypothetical protein
MAFQIGLVLGRRSLAGVIMDALVSETHKMTSTMTKLPMENGVRLTDHVIQDPRALTLTFTTSNALGANLVSDTINSALNAIGGNDSLQRGTQEMYEAVKRAWENRELLDVVTENDYYGNMEIVDVSAMQAAPVKGSLQFSVQLEQTDFVDLSEIEIPESLLAQDVAPTGSSAVVAGTESPSPLSSNRSLLSRLGG